MLVQWVLTHWSCLVKERRTGCLWTPSQSISILVGNRIVMVQSSHSASYHRKVASNLSLASQTLFLVSRSSKKAFSLLRVVETLKLRNIQPAISYYTSLMIWIWISCLTNHTSQIFSHWSKPRSLVTAVIQLKMIWAIWKERILFKSQETYHQCLKTNEWRVQSMTQIQVVTNTPGMHPRQRWWS